MTLKQQHKTDKMAIKDTKMGWDYNSDKIKGKDMYGTIVKNTNKNIKQFLLNGQNERFWNSEILHVGLTNMYPIPCHKRASKTETQDRRCNFAQGRGDHKSWCSNGRSFCSMTEAHGNMLLKAHPMQTDSECSVTSGFSFSNFRPLRDDFLLLPVEQSMPQNSHNVQ